MTAVALPWTTELGLWAAILVCAPLAAAPGAFILGDRRAPWLVGLAAVAQLVAAVALVAYVFDNGAARHALGGWPVPLGISWRVDGTTAALLLVTALVGTGVAAFAVGHLPRAELERTPDRFWPGFLLLWAGLNALFLSFDIFNIYVTLELVSLAAIVLVTLERKGEALRAAMRYLLVAQAGSLCYLLGVALLYGFGTLDIEGIARRAQPTVAALVAVALMTAGLFAKAALFPMHAWLPPAHASAPSPASALLSGLVVTASVVVLLRLWADVFLPLAGPVAPQVLGWLGAAGVLWGSLCALRQVRVKMLLAYSTVAQLGYLLLIVPLLGDGGGWAGGLYLALAHAMAKAAMFMAAGVLLMAIGRDDLDSLAGAARRLPMTVFALGLGGLNLIGLPPSGGFIGKWLLVGAAFATGQWWWGVVILSGSLFAAGYVFRMLSPPFRPAEVDVVREVPPWLEAIPLLLASVSLIMGLAGAPLVALLGTGLRA